ncbi:MAG: O-antigen ligase family protein [Fibrobacter sp.]|nr:O-antigen ligase family protein [Fibrobacter sp.]
MFSVAVLLLFFTLFGAMILGRKDYGYVWVLLSLVLFPPCIYFTQSPQVSPQQAFIYGFFVLAVFTNRNALMESIFKHPLKIPLFLLFGSLVTTSVLNGEGGKGVYNALRYYTENYAYLFVAFMGGLCYKNIKIEDKWFYPIMALCALGVVEFLLKSNLVFPLICKAFPYYDGYFDLSSAVSASRTYRSRIFVTTTHPTVLGCMMSCALIMFTCCLKKLSWQKNKIVIAWCSLFLLVVLSGSRTAIACSLLGLLLFVFGKVNIRIKFLVVVIMAFAVANYAQRFIDEFSVEGQGSSLSLRQEQLLFSYLQFMKSPIYGNGIRYTSKYVMERDTYNDRVTDSEIGGLESVIFFQLIDYGFIGISSYILLFLFAFYYFFKRRRFEYAQSGLLVTIVFFVFACMSGEIGGNNTFAYMLIGYCMGATRIEEQDEEELENQEESEGNDTKPLNVTKAEKVG